MAVAIELSAARGELPTGRGVVHPGRRAGERVPLGVPPPNDYDIEEQLDGRTTIISKSYSGRR